MKSLLSLGYALVLFKKGIASQTEMFRMASQLIITQTATVAVLASRCWFEQLAFTKVNKTINAKMIVSSNYV